MALNFSPRNKLTVTIQGNRQAGKSTVMMKMAELLGSQGANVTFPGMTAHQEAELEAMAVSPNVKSVSPAILALLDIALIEKTNPVNYAQNFTMPREHPGPDAQVIDLIHNYPYPRLVGMETPVVIRPQGENDHGVPKFYYLYGFDTKPNPYRRPDWQPQLPHESLTLWMQTQSLENGRPDGLRVEDLLAIAEDQLVKHQKSTLACPENDVALRGIRSALAALHGRTEQKMLREPS